MENKIKIFGVKSIIILSLFWIVIVIILACIYKDGRYLFLFALSWYLIHGFLFFKIIRVSAKKMIVKNILNPFKKNKTIDLKGIDRITLRTTGIKGRTTSIIFYFKLGHEERVDLYLRKFELKRLQNTLQEKGLKVDDFI